MGPAASQRGLDPPPPQSPCPSHPLCLRSGSIAHQFVTLLVQTSSGALTLVRLTRGPTPTYADAVAPALQRRRPMLPQATPPSAAGTGPVTLVFDVRGQTHYFLYQAPQPEAYVTMLSPTGQFLRQYTLTLTDMQLDHIRRCLCPRLKAVVFVYQRGPMARLFRVSTPFHPLPPPPPEGPSYRTAHCQPHSRRRSHRVCPRSDRNCTGNPNVQDNA